MGTHLRLGLTNAGLRVEASRVVVGRVAGASDRRRVGVDAEVGEDGHDHVALVDFGDDIAASSAGASEDVLEINSSQERGPVNSRAARGQEPRAEARPRSARGRRLVASSGTMIAAIRPRHCGLRRRYATRPSGGSRASRARRQGVRRRTSTFGRPSTAISNVSPTWPISH